MPLAVDSGRSRNRPTSCGSRSSEARPTDYNTLSESLSNWNEHNECYEIYAAQGELSDRVFRIFNMGEYDLKTYERFLHALEICLKKK